ncbi:MAG: hypothetical protein ACREDR_45055, partial [Blastocatellia bacterium]
SAVIDMGAYEVQTPKISSVLAVGKDLSLFGLNFDVGAVILMDGIPRSTKAAASSASTNLVGKKLMKQIDHGQQVKLQVMNASGALSNEMNFTRP